MRVNEQEAAELARQVLIFLANDPDRIGRFLAVTGVGPVEIRERVSDLTFLGGVLDYLLSDEPLLMAFVEGADIPPEQPAQWRQSLPGAPLEG